MKYIFIFVLLFNFCFSSTMQRDDSLNIVIDQENRLMWMDDISILKFQKNHEDAVKYCQTLSFSGFEDWRIPEIEELQLIVDKTNEKSYINRAFKYNFKDGFWARKAHWRTLWFYADYMYFVSGTPYYDSRHKLKFVRCVRDLK